MENQERTEAQKEASRRNGRRSRGAVTAEGRARSSQNAMKHGLFSSRTVLANESQEAFDLLLQRYLHEWSPVGASEVDLVQDLTIYRWKLTRARNLEDAARDSEMFIQKEDYDLCYEKHDPAIRHHDAENALHNTSPGLIEFYAVNVARLQRLITRVTNDLIRLQKLRLGHAPVRNPEIEVPLQPVPPEPQPQSEQQDAVIPGNDPEPRGPSLPEVGKTYPEPELFTWLSGIDKAKLNPIKLPKIIDLPKPPASGDLLAHLRKAS